MKERHLCRICCMIIAWFFLYGFIRGQTAPVVCPVPEGESVRVGGTVYRQEWKGDNQSIYLKDISFINPEAGSLPEIKNWKTRRIIAYLKNACPVDIGSRLTVEGVCACPQGQRNPGGFDARQYYGTQNIGMFLMRAGILERGAGIFPIRDALSDLRLFLRRRLERAGEDTDAGVLAAMLLGDKGGLDSAIQDLYKDAGIIHLLAISGLHVSLTGMALYRLLRRIRLGFGSSAAASGAIMAAYACITGYPVSAVRAVIMFVIYLLSQVAGRTYDMPTSLALAAAVLLFFRGGVLWQAGFWLSFAAVAGVAVSSLWQSRALKGTSLGISMAVQLVTLPVICFYYYEFPLYAVFLNILVIPLMPLIFGFGMAGMAAAVVSVPLGTFLLAPAHYLLEAVAFLCEKTRLLPFSRIVTGKPGLPLLAGYYIGLGLVLYILWRRCKCRTAVHDTAAASVALLFVLLVIAGRSRSFIMTVLDVGQGDGICIQNEGHSVWMIDGGSASEAKTADQCLEPFLKSQGISAVDCWMISHVDADHVSGLLEVLNAYEKGLDGGNAAGISIGSILLSENSRASRTGKTICRLAQAQGIAVHVVGSGDVLRDGGMRVRILAPERGAVYEGENAASVVAEVTYGTFSALLTGDVEGEGEQELIQSGSLRDVDVLKAAHHGSRGATSMEFLELTRPELTVISCGKNNRFGHPHGELLERLEKCGSRVARTDLQGAVRIIIKK